jgi:hypothetical protein
MLKKILKFFFGFFLLLLLILISTEFFTGVFKFPKPKAFSGENWYNPYKNADFTVNAWKKANFHAHSKAWSGLTNGRNVSPAEVKKNYGFIGYDIMQISDYMKINPFADTLQSYIPTYEHGYGITKNHHLCIGASKVDWIEFPLFQTLHHKQTIINKLRNNVEVLCIAHPMFNNANKPDDFNYLTNYDLVEVLNHYYNSAPCWDSALSSGHPVFIIANDDMHDLQGKDEFGVCATYINTQEVNRKNIVSALKSGNAYGVEFTFSDNDNNDIKALRIKNTPYLTGFSLSGDTLKVTMSDTSFKFRFIGQNGKHLKSSPKGKESYYLIKPKDTYVRVEIYFADSSKIYLNPVFRYSGENPLKKSPAIERNFISVLLKIVIIAFWLLIIYFFAVKPYVDRKRRKSKS